MDIIYPTLSETYQVVENALEIIGLQIEHARNAEEGQWSLFRGEHEVFIDAWDSGNEDAWNYYFEEKQVPIIQALAPVCALPLFDRDEFMAELLEINLHLFNAAFMIKAEENMCCIRHRMVVLDKDPMPVVQMIESVGYYAEFFASRLMAKYKVAGNV